MVYLVFVLYDIYIYKYKCRGKSKIHQSFEKNEYSSHTHVKLTCGLIVLTVC